MQLSKRCEYGLRTLITLGIARAAGRELVPVQELAAKERLPTKFLEQILRQLREAGLIFAKRGKSGGYYWSARTGKTPIAEIVRLIDGPLAPIRCVSATCYEPCSCPDETHCGLRMLMLDVRNAVATILERHTLDDVVTIAVRKLRSSGLRTPFAPEDLPVSTGSRRGKSARRKERP